MHVHNITPVDREEFYVSYNPCDTAIYGDVSTALVWGQMQGFYILLGDHQEAYKALESQGWDACYAYYLSQSQAHSKYSDKQFPPLTLTEMRDGRRMGGMR